MNDVEFIKPAIFDYLPHDAKSYNKEWLKQHPNYTKQYYLKNKQRIDRLYREWYKNMKSEEKEIYLEKHRSRDKKKYWKDKIKARWQEIKENK